MPSSVTVRSLITVRDDEIAPNDVENQKDNSVFNRASVLDDLVLTENDYPNLSVRAMTPKESAQCQDHHFRIKLHRTLWQYLVQVM